MVTTNLGRIEGEEWTRSLAPSDSPVRCFTGSVTDAISWKPMGKVTDCDKAGTI